MAEKKYNRKILTGEFIKALQQDLALEFGVMSDANVRQLNKIFFGTITRLLAIEEVESLLLPIGKLHVGTIKACRRYIPILNAKVDIQERQRILFRPAAPFLSQINDRSDLNISKDYTYKKKLKKIDVTDPINSRRGKSC